jgi:hypothetical protein
LSEFANDDKDALLATRYPHSKRLLTYKTTRKAKENEMSVRSTMKIEQMELK